MENTIFDSALVELARQQVHKQAYVDNATLASGGGAPMDPAAMGGGGMPLPDPAMMAGMDPSMMGGAPPGGAPPMDPSMMGGAPPTLPAPPMDPSMMGGAPPAPPASPPPPAPPAGPDLGAIERRLAALEQGGGEKKKKADIPVEIAKIREMLTELGNALGIPLGQASTPAPGAEGEATSTDSSATSSPDSGIQPIAPFGEGATNAPKAAAYAGSPFPAPSIDQSENMRNMQSTASILISLLGQKF